MPSLLVVGSGVAGLTAALRAAALGADVTLVTKSPLSEGSTRHAQGGIAAALADDDDPTLHAADTLRAGAGGCDPAAVEALCAEGPARVRELLAAGVPFDRDGDALRRGTEAAHSRARILHAGGDATGAAIESVLADAARAVLPTILEHAFLADLVVRDGRVRGVQLLTPEGARRLEADAVLLATGGAGRLFSHTTNPVQATGDGTAAALRAGALLADLEFYQFHPTALATPGGFLVSEAVRGEGAVLVDDAGRRFMRDVHSDAELAPRDVVARGIATAMAGQSGRPVRLDATALGGRFLARRFPTIDAACRAAGLDWGREPIPVTPAAHYWMGGVLTDLDGRTSLPGLLAAGETACTGVHGANRLASNSLLEGLVFARRAVDAFFGDPGRAAAPLPADVRVPSRTGAPAHDRGPVGGRTIARDENRLPTAPRTPDPRAALTATLWADAGLQRSAEGLLAAQDALAALPVSGSPATPREHEDRNLVGLGGALVAAALARRESRGAHYRTDFPAPAPGPVRRLVVRSAEATAEPVPDPRRAVLSC